MGYDYSHGASHKYPGPPSRKSGFRVECPVIRDQKPEGLESGAMPRGGKLLPRHGKPYKGHRSVPKPQASAYP